MEGKERDHHNDEEKEKKTSKLDPLPLDLEVEILTRLPAKSLWKFRCVSKIWSSIIGSQRFSDSFFAMSLKQSRFIIALSSGERREKNVFFFSASDERNESSPFSLVANLDMTIPKWSLNDRSWPCASSVHGFLGVNVGSRFFICNPSTNQVIKFNNNNKFLVYDPIDAEHKVISVNQCRNLGYHYLKVFTVGGGGGESGRRIKDAGGESGRRIKDAIIPYTPLSVGVCINGFLYYGACTQTDAVIVRLDVRSEKLSFIKAPKDVLWHGDRSIMIEYKGKLASINVGGTRCFDSFDLWVLEDVEKHEWSKQTYVVPFSIWDSVTGLCFSGTNKAGEIIMAPMSLSEDVRQPFYIFYYNLETKNVRRVEIQGTEEIRRRHHKFEGDDGSFEVCIIPQHVESISFL